MSSSMPYSHRNLAAEQKEACQKAKQVTETCKQLSIMLDPIDWQHAGMRAPVTVNTLEISDLFNLSRQDTASILRHVRIKLLEHAALATVHAQPGCKALVWSPVDVVQPQAFVSLWIITLETQERVTIAEYIRNGWRVYEPYEYPGNNQHLLAELFGPVHTGEYQLGEIVSIEEREHSYTGEIVYILPPSKASANHAHPSKGRHLIVGKAHANDSASRYLVDCRDGFPHIVNQWQIISEISKSED
ncbi:MAG TPA: hypothetical protein VH593_22330 [Ktedonobacteraceae bacterium]